MGAVCSCSQQFQQIDDAVTKSHDIVTVDETSVWPGTIFNIADLKHILFADTRVKLF